MHRYLFLILFFAAVLPAQARLGETKDQCIARYGKPQSQNSTPDTLTFIKNGVEIDATFENGKCVDLIFNKETSSAFTDDEVNLLLDDNSQGQQWKVDPTPKQFEGSTTLKEWTRTDGSDASIMTGKQIGGEYTYLDICTKAYFDKQVTQSATDAKAEAAKKLQGF